MRELQKQELQVLLMYPLLLYLRCTDVAPLGYPYRALVPFAAHARLELVREFQKQELPVDVFGELCGQQEHGRRGPSASTVALLFEDFAAQGRRRNSVHPPPWVPEAGYLWCSFAVGVGTP